MKPLEPTFTYSIAFDSPYRNKSYLATNEIFATKSKAAREAEKWYGGASWASIKRRRGLRIVRVAIVAAEDVKR